MRLGVSLALGVLIGLQRQMSNHPAGIRTFTLISLGCTVATLASIYICENNLELINGDPGRIAAQVLTGIGFLGAGLIMKSDGEVKGLTTAATIFVTAAVGVAVGVGMIWGGVAAAVLTFAILASSSFLDKKHEDKK